MEAADNDSVNRDLLFMEYFVETLTDNGNFLLELIQAADYAANTPLPLDSDDDIIESRMTTKTLKLLSKLWQDTYDVWKVSHDARTASSDEKSEDPIELEDEEDLREEQDENGRYYIMRDGERVYNNDK